MEVKEKEKKAQELYVEFQALEQHIKQLQKQLEVVTHQLIDLNATNQSLGDFKKQESGKEIFVPLSSGIFAKASIMNTSELLVNVGANVALIKDVDSTKRLIQKQIDDMKKIQKQMVDELEKMTNHAVSLERQLQEFVS